MPHDSVQTETLHYATPAHARPKRPVNPALALTGGIFLASLGALVLIFGLVFYSQVTYRLGSDERLAMLSSTIVFSAVCLFAGLPLIYRAARGNELKAH